MKLHGSKIMFSSIVIVLAAGCAERPRPLSRPVSQPAARADAVERGQAVERWGRVVGADADGCTWVEGEVSVLVGEQDTRHQARASALEQARAAAVQDLLGAEISSRFMDFQQEGLRGQERLTESILQTTRSGRILKEKVLEEGYRDAADCASCRYRLKLQACVASRESGTDKDFRVELALNRSRFVHGDPATVSITATRDCWVYVYDVYDLASEAKTALLVPSRALSEKRLRAGQTWEYPDEEARRDGVSELRAELPRAEDEVSAETLRVVASKAPLPLKIYDPADGGWLGVLRRLHRSSLEWTDDAEAFTIYRR